MREEERPACLGSVILILSVRPSVRPITYGCCCITVLTSINKSTNQKGETGREKGNLQRLRSPFPRLLIAMAIYSFSS